MGLIPTAETVKFHKMALAIGWRQDRDGIRSPLSRQAAGRCKGFWVVFLWQNGL